MRGRSSRFRSTTGILVVVLCSGIAYGASRLTEVGAGGLLHPARRHSPSTPPASCENATFAGLEVSLKGWHCRTTAPRRGTLVYLHGVADNRASAAGIIGRFVRRGFDVVAYDSRAHGESGGEACTYGFYEKEDLRRVLNHLEPGPIVLLGTSLGAAVALQEASGDSRVSAIVAVETFSDLRTVAADRAPFFVTRRAISGVFEFAERLGRFHVDAVSPLEAARTITAPVLLIHGDADVDTPPDHSRRVFDALRGSKRLTIVRGAAHNESLRGEVWHDVDRWIDDALAAPLN
jgi:uncharacterized protein